MSERGAVEVRAEILDGFWTRLRGLLGRPVPGAGEGVWITPCRQVHTLGMTYPIDVLHLDGAGRVLSTQTLRPWRLGRYVFAAVGVLELRSGEAARLGIEEGVSVRLIGLGRSC